MKLIGKQRNRATAPGFLGEAVKYSEHPANVEADALLVVLVAIGVDGLSVIRHKNIELAHSILQDSIKCCYKGIQDIRSQLEREKHRGSVCVLKPTSGIRISSEPPDLRRRQIESLKPRPRTRTM